MKPSLIIEKQAAIEILTLQDCFAGPRVQEPALESPEEYYIPQFDYTPSLGHLAGLQRARGPLQASRSGWVLPVRSYHSMFSIAIFAWKNRLSAVFLVLDLMNLVIARQLINRFICSLYTFFTHPWIIRDSKTEDRLSMIVHDQPEREHLNSPCQLVVVADAEQDSYVSIV